jgi:hypothetical protein
MSAMNIAQAAGVPIPPPGLKAKTQSHASGQIQVVGLGQKMVIDHGHGSVGTTATRMRTPKQKVADLMKRIKGGETNTSDLRKILKGITGLTSVRRTEIEAMITERGKLMSKKGFIKKLEKEAKSEAERASVAAQEAQLAKEEKALVDAVDNITDLLSGISGLSGF